MFSAISSWPEVVVASLILGGYLLLPSFPVYVQRTYGVLTFFLTKMSRELFAYLLDVYTHITEENNLKTVSLLHKSYMFILEKVENKII